jgi:hypothetical protein
MSSPSHKLHYLLPEKVGNISNRETRSNRNKFYNFKSRTDRFKNSPLGYAIDKYNNNIYCYIASVNTKRDWLICSHVALDKCNVSRPGNK